MRTYIICKTNLTGNTVFECKNCGRHISAFKVSSTKQCPKCNKVFKPVIKIEKV